MKYLLRADAFVGRHMALFVLLCVTLGVAFPTFFAPINRVTMGLFAFMTFASSLGGGFRELRDVALHPLPAVLTLLILHIVMPVVALWTGGLLFPDAPLFTTGLVLEYAIPTGVATLMWSNIGRANVTFCLSLVLLDTLCSPVVVPLTMRLLSGSVVEMDTLGMMGDLLIMVAIPAALAMTLYQLTGGRVAQTWKPRLSPFSKMAMLLIVISNATGCAPFLRNITPTLVLVMAAVFFLCLLGFFLGFWAGRLVKTDFPTAEAMALNSGMRNLSAGAVLAQQYFPTDVLFPVAFSPLFLQVTTAFILKGLRATKAGRADQAAWEQAQADSAPASSPTH